MTLPPPMAPVRHIDPIWLRREAGTVGGYTALACRWGVTRATLLGYMHGGPVPADVAARIPDAHWTVTAAATMHVLNWQVQP